MKEYKVETNWKTPIAVNFVKSKSGMPDGEFRDRFGIGQMEIEAAMDGRDTIHESNLRTIAGYFGLTLAQVCGAESI